MRALLPVARDDVDLLEAYATPDRQGRPFVRCNMISSVDGAIAVHGRSGALGGPADRIVFAALRSLADVVVVGAGTARAEGYGPVRLSDDLRRARAGRGQPPVPPIAVVTRSAQLDWSSPLFADAEQRPIIVTTADANPGEIARARAVADVVEAGADEVDLASAVTQLASRGYTNVLAEGGPGINAQLVAARLVDELCLTLSPSIVAGTGPRILAGDELPVPLSLRTVHLLEQDGYLFGRFAVS
ncbi:MAG TPA: pyrimidine reductase family protein [Acidimicrobiales bacterium]|nr:pyrimidine reductase family protein [Acidimicrobiales bacterium]